MQKVVGDTHLEARDGFLVGPRQGGVDPGHDGVISHLLAIAQILQDVEGVPEVKKKRWSPPPRSMMTPLSHTHMQMLLSPSHELP